MTDCGRWSGCYWGMWILGDNVWMEMTLMLEMRTRMRIRV